MVGPDCDRTDVVKVVRARIIVPRVFKRKRAIRHKLQCLLVLVRDGAIKHELVAPIKCLVALGWCGNAVSVDLPSGLEEPRAWGLRRLARGSSWTRCGESKTGALKMVSVYWMAVAS